MMTLNPRQSINPEENWLSGNSCSWFVVAWRPVLPPNVKDRWFPCWSSYVAAGPPDPTCDTKTRPLARFNQSAARRLAAFLCAIWYVRRATSRLWDTFNHQRGGSWLCCCCRWRPGRRDRGASCLPVITKAFWRRGRSKIRYSRSV